MDDLCKQLEVKNLKIRIEDTTLSCNDILMGNSCRSLEEQNVKTKALLKKPEIFHLTKMYILFLFPCNLPIVVVVTGVVVVVVGGVAGLVP